MTMKHVASLVLAVASMALLECAVAAVSAEEAQKLGNNLTPWGAEKQGNADGTIPEYTGGMTKPPANYVEGSGKWVDPFPDEKPLLSIDATNVAQYAAQVTPGVQELIRRWPDSYRINVYPTHRTQPQMSAARAEATYRNATNPTCTTTGGGVGIEGCSGGVPFPIPKTGNEAMWNHLLSERDAGGYLARGTNLVVDAAGNLSTPQDWALEAEYAYWAGTNTDYYYRRITTTLAPPRMAGGKNLIWYPLAFDQKDQRSWSYSTGQRRVRLAPEYTYDTPITNLGGVLFYDEANMFAGRMDRFDFKLVGKQEMYVPYNSFRAVMAPREKLIGKNHILPESVRWELHRVWVVEATLKEGVRHAASKRRYYLDEDSWMIVASEGYDQAGKIFRVLLGNTAPNYITGVGGVDFNSSVTVYDLARGGYCQVAWMGDPKNFYKPVGKFPSTTFAPEVMAGRGVR